MKMVKQAKVTPQEARDAIKKYGGLRPAARALGMDNGFLSRIAKRSGTVETAGREEVRAEAKPANSKTLADFRRVYDKNTIIPQKIKDAIRVLGPSGWEYETEFSKMAGVGLCDLGKFRDMFADNIVEIRRSGKRAWAGGTALARQMREML